MKKIMTGLAVTLFTVLLIANPVAVHAYPSDGSSRPSDNLASTASPYNEDAAKEKAKSANPGMTIPESFNVNDPVVITLDESTGVKVGDYVRVFVYSEPILLSMDHVRDGLKVTLPAGTLKDLPDGEHTLAVYTIDGKLIAARAIIKNGEIVALDTADGSSFTALGVLPIVALVGVAGVGFVAYRRFAAANN